MRLKCCINNLKKNYPYCFGKICLCFLKDELSKCITDTKKKCFGQNQFLPLLAVYWNLAITTSNGFSQIVTYVAPFPRFQINN